MAEKGAHLTQTVHIKPSIFDYIAQETLNDLLYPSAKKIIDFLAIRHNLFVNVSNWFDEYFLLSNSLLQFYYLKNYGATFSEKFYGLQRTPIKDLKINLSDRELILSLVAVSLFPYLRLKLNDISEKLFFEKLPLTNQKKKIYFMKSIIYFNNGANIFYVLLKFIQHLRCLSGNSDIHSPLLWAAGVKLKYANEENEINNPLTLRNFIPQLLQRGLEVGAFFIQFMQWWQNEKSSSINPLPIPPPPPKGENGIKFSNKCPLCLNKRKVETVLSTSGFVFCFSCISSYVMKFNRCPITGLPTTMNSLIRIYPPS